MTLNREKEICSQSRGFLQAISCLLEITTLRISQQQHQHIVKKHEEPFDSLPPSLLIPLGGEVGEWEETWQVVGCFFHFFPSTHSHLIKQNIILKFKNNISLVTRKIGDYMSFFFPGQRAWLSEYRLSSSLQSQPTLSHLPSFAVSTVETFFWSETKTVCLSGSPTGAAWPRWERHQRGG